MSRQVKVVLNQENMDRLVLGLDVTIRLPDVDIKVKVAPNVKLRVEDKTSSILEQILGRKF